MIQKIKSVLDLVGENKKLKQTIKDLQKELDIQGEMLMEAHNAIPEPKDILEVLLSMDLKWFDYNELSPENMQVYHNEAQYILRSNIFNNELNFLKNNWGKQAVLDGVSKETPAEVAEHVKKMGWMILGIEYLKVRLQEMPDPTKPAPTTNDINSAI